MDYLVLHSSNAKGVAMFLSSISHQIEDIDSYYLIECRLTPELRVIAQGIDGLIMFRSRLRAEDYIASLL